MKKITSKILIVALAMLAMGACTNTKNKEAANRHYQVNGDAVYPTIEGLTPHAVTLENKGDSEANLKVQIEVGKLMEVDCNLHRLNGNFIEKTLEGYGYEYYIFETDGNIASTMMACPDDTKTEKFVSGDDQFISYNSNLTIPVYAPEGYEVRFTTWSIDNTYTSNQKPVEATNPEVAKQVKHFPESLEGYERYVFYLPKYENEDSYRLEIVPGIMKEVDCNTHWLIGEFETKEVEGMGYNYMVFKSDGDIASTRMACPDEALTEQFIPAQGYLQRYNSNMSVIVFAPKGMRIKLNTWKAGDTKVAEKM